MINKPLAVIFDIDGVLVDSSYIEKQARKSKVNVYDYFKTHLEESSKYGNKPITDMFESYCNNPGYKVFIITSRLESIRKETEYQLKLISNCRYDGLFMREDDDFKQSQEIKKEHLKELQKNFNVVLVIDDEDSNIRMYRRNGVKYVIKVF